MAVYIYELADWPQFRWSGKGLAEQLAATRHRQGRLIGRMEGLGLKLRAEATLRTLTEEVVKSSEIEGEILNRDQVRSSLARRLGVDIGALTPADRNVEGIVEMILDATEKYDAPLTAERLFGWHAALFPTGRSGMRKITVGNWRTEEAGPMQVVSGPIGREPRAFGKKRAAFLQHVRADSAGAQRLLRYSGSDAEGRSRHHLLVGMVSCLSQPRVRWRRNDIGIGAPQGQILESTCR